MKTVKTLVALAAVAIMASCSNSRYADLPDGVYADIKVEKGNPAGASCFYVTFGNKTMTLYETYIVAAEDAVKERKNDNVKYPIKESGNFFGEKLFDKITEYTRDQIVSLKKIIDIVLANSGE